MRMTTMALAATLTFAGTCADVHAAGPAYPAFGDPSITHSESYLRGRPDIRWRQQGITSYQKGDYRQAFERFQRAARYGDKLSQAMVAEMLWNGRGTLRDRAAGYAWMDLAAERQDRDLVLKREYYWSRLTSDEQARAIAEGGVVYDTFGDAVALPRLERETIRVQRGMTGSRVGWAGFMTVQPHTGTYALDARDATVYFDERYWDTGRE